MPTPGARPPLVLLSGMLGDERLWDGVAERIADVAVPWPERIDLDDSVGEMAETVLAAVPPRFVLAGHSLGGIVALEIARRAPERVHGLALVATSPRPPSGAQLATWSEWGARTRAGEFAELVADIGPAMLAERRRSVPELAQCSVAMAERIGPEGFLRQLAAQATRPDSRPSLPSLALATLVLSGADDTTCPPALQDELADGIAGAELVSVAGGGHLLPLECPEDVSTALRSWLPTLS